MSAPRVVNTTDGTVWTLREGTRGGEALYAPEKCGQCPQFVMPTLAELAEHGIAGSADVLPMPVGPEPRTWEQGDEAASLRAHSEFLMRDVKRLRAELAERTQVLVDTDAERERLRARVAGLEAERHVTNEALDDVVQALREKEKREAVVAGFVAARAEYVTALRNCHGDNTHDYDRWQGHAAARRQLAEELGLPVAWPPEDAVSVAKSVDKLTRLLAPSQALREDEPAPKCRCDEPDADPYACEAEDCTHEFSELNPFGGGPVEGHDAKVSRKCSRCDFRTSVWHVNDGSAEEELHGHVTRVHGGTVPAETGGV